MFNKQQQIQKQRFNNWNVILYTIITIIIVGFIVFYYTVQHVCAEDIIESCTPTMPFPSSITPTSDPTETPTPTNIPVTPTTIEATPTAGQSATMPLKPPETGRG